MNNKQKTLLALDGIINLVLGFLLLLFPAGIVDYLGLPAPNTFFYPTILGGVIFGIGIALLLELFFSEKIRGLGLVGAIAINFSGGLVLLYWLIFTRLDIPGKGLIVLWIVAIVVLGMGLIELVTKSWMSDQ